MPYLAIERSHLYYEVHGSSGPVLVLCHGASANHAGWFSQIDALSRGYQVVVFDARGFGNSTDAEGVGRAGFLDELTAVLDEVNADRVVLIGHSMGGGACVGFTCRYPHRVAALILECTLVGLELLKSTQAVIDEAFQRSANSRQVERVLGKTALGNSLVASLFTQIGSFNSIAPREISGAFEIFSLAGLCGTKVPILFVAGQEDVLFAPELIRSVHERVAGSGYAVIADAGHTPHFEQPVRFNGVVLDWLRSIGLGGSVPV